MDNDSTIESPYEHQSQGLDAVKEFVVIGSDHDGSSETPSSTKTNGARAMQSLR